MHLQRTPLSNYLPLTFCICPARVADCITVSTSYLGIKYYELYGHGTKKNYLL